MLVNTRTLASVAKTLGFGNLLKLSKGEEESMGRENISLLADSFEAFIGALFLDLATEEVSNFLNLVLLPKADIFLKKTALKDPKSLLQELIQAKKQRSPVYSVIKEEGPPHRKIFTIAVYVDKNLLGKGYGKSKQEAEKNAAKKALETLKS